MTVGISAVNTANALLNAIRAGGTTKTAPTNTYAKLHVGDPGAAGAANAAAGDTTRKSFTQAAASGGALAMNGTAPVWTNGGVTETITHISVWDDPTAGNFIVT